MHVNKKCFFVIKIVVFHSPKFSKIGLKKTEAIGFHVVIDVNPNFAAPTKQEVFESLSEIKDCSIIIVSCEEGYDRKRYKVLRERFHLFVKAYNLTITRSIIEYTLVRFFRR